MEVNKVFDHADISNKVNWYWKDMHMARRLSVATLWHGHRAWATALRAYLVRRSFLSCLDRIWRPDPYIFRFQEILSTVPPAHFPTADGAVAMAFVGRAVRRDQGFSVSQYLVALSMFVLLIDRKRSVGLAVLAGISTATIPYGYAGIRLVLPFLILLAIVCFRRIEKYNLCAYLGTILAICAIQIGDYPRSLQMYFYARGENLISAARRLPNGGYDLAFIAHKLTENFHVLFRMIMGLNGKAFWNVNVASTLTPIADVVLYPRFLVPLFIVGLVYSLAHAYKQKRFILAMPVLLFLPGLVPNMMSGIGIPNLRGA